MPIARPDRLCPGEHDSTVKGVIDMTKESTHFEDKPVVTAARELDENQLDRVAGGSEESWSTAEQDSALQTADGKYVAAKLVGRPK
jgi:hypothetical protein